MIRRVPIKEVAEVNPRLPKEADPAQKVSFLSMASVSESGDVVNQESRILQETKKGYTYFERGDVLLAKITPCFENGKAALLDRLDTRIGFGSTEFHVLRPDPAKINPKYLFYLVWSDHFRFHGQKSMQGAAGQKRVSASFVKDFEIPLPPLPEQKRIATILEKADALRRKRQQAIELADQFLQSVFLEMFGDLLSNSMNWPTFKFKDLIVKGPSNGVYKPSSSYGEGTKILRIDGFYNGRILSTKEMKRVRLSDNELDRYKLFDREVIINRVNSREYLGKSALFEGESEPVVFESNMMRIGVDESRVAPRFIVDQLCSVFVKKQILSSCKDAVNQSSINQNDVKGIELRIPPLPLQKRYVEIVEKLRAGEKNSLYQKTELENLFSSLSQTLLYGNLK